MSKTDEKKIKAALDYEASEPSLEEETENGKEEAFYTGASVNEEQKTQLGKFKDPEELLRAYRELEKEFTRRSQKLGALEAELEAFKKPYEPDEEEWKQTVDKFFANTPAARPFAKDMARILVDDPSLKTDRNCLFNALARVLSEKFRTPEQLMDDEEFLNGYVLGSEKVKNAVIEGYLKGLAKGMPPVTLKGGGERVAALPNKPKSIEEAGVLFLKNNK